MGAIRRSLVPRSWLPQCRQRQLIDGMSGDFPCSHNRDVPTAAPGSKIQVEKEAAMQKWLRLNGSRRALLAAGAVWALNTALQSRPGFTQTNSNEKLRIGVIGSGRMGGT